MEPALVLAVPNNTYRWKTLRTFAARREGAEALGPDRSAQATQTRREARRAPTALRAARAIGTPAQTCPLSCFSQGEERCGDGAAWCAFPARVARTRMDSASYASSAQAVCAVAMRSWPFLAPSATASSHAVAHLLAFGLSFLGWLSGRGAVSPALLTSALATAGERRARVAHAAALARWTTRRCCRSLASPSRPLRSAPPCARPACRRRCRARARNTDRRVQRCPPLLFGRRSPRALPPCSQASCRWCRPRTRPATPCPRPWCNTRRLRQHPAPTSPPPGRAPTLGGPSARCARSSEDDASSAASAVLPCRCSDPVRRGHGPPRGVRDRSCPCR